MDELEQSTERWLPVVGCEGWYEVSDLGRVRRIRPGPSTKIGRLLIPSSNYQRRGELSVVLSTGEPGGRGRRVRSVHRLVAEAFIGSRPRGYDLNHKNGEITDNRPENLEYVT